MFKKKYFIMILFLLLGILIFGACAHVQTPAERRAWMLTVYNNQYADYQRMTGHEWNDLKNDWEKTSDPILSESTKKVLRNKKKILEQVYPLIEIYDSDILSGKTPDIELENQITNLLNMLLDRL